MKKTCVLVLAAVVLATLGPAPARARSQGSKDVPKAVVEVIKKHCATCHTGQRPPKGLSLIPSKIASAVDAPSAEVPALRIINTETPEASYMLKKILGAKDIVEAKMPRGRKMPEADLEILKAWILGLRAK